MIEKKTASLFDVSCQLGAEFSHASVGEAKILGQFGRSMGLAFQIVDDCLDIIGDEDDLGKSLGTDMKKGKLTLPFIRLLARSKGVEKKNLEEMMAPPLTVEKMQRLREVLQEKEAVEEAVSTAIHYIDQAKELIQRLDQFDSEVLSMLISFTDQIFSPLREKFPALP